MKQYTLQFISQFIYMSNSVVLLSAAVYLQQYSLARLCYQ